MSLDLQIKQMVNGFVSSMQVSLLRDLCPNTLLSPYLLPLSSSADTACLDCRSPSLSLSSHLFFHHHHTSATAAAQPYATRAHRAYMPNLLSICIFKGLADCLMDNIWCNVRYMCVTDPVLFILPKHRGLFKSIRCWKIIYIYFYSMNIVSCLVLHWSVHFVSLTVLYFVCIYERLFFSSIYVLYIVNNYREVGYICLQILDPLSLFLFYFFYNVYVQIN